MGEGAAGAVLEAGVKATTEVVKTSAETATSTAPEVAKRATETATKLTPSPGDISKMTSVRDELTDMKSSKPSEETPTQQEIVQQRKPGPLETTAYVISRLVKAGKGLIGRFTGASA